MPKLPLCIHYEFLRTESGKVMAQSIRRFSNEADIHCNSKGLKCISKCRYDLNQLGAHIP